MKTLKGLVLTLIATFTLVGCGGGGDSGGTTSTPQVSAEGVWQGTTSTGYTINLVALENNEIWTVFGNLTPTALLVVGFDKVNGTTIGNVFEGTGREYYNNGTTAAGTVKATITQNTLINGTVSSSIGSASFSTTPIPTSNFDYNKRAQITDISGSWTGTLLNGATSVVSISSTGSITGSSVGCSFSGTATPRASGKNIFNTTITFGNLPCTLANQTVSGIALSYLTNTGKTQLIVGLTDPSNTRGTMFLALR
ncbi:MAG: hypothetical protein EBU08_19585 [Micrococcales bacterium]|nr:hypothetical protein [Micrococcales bacterium]